MNGDAGDYVILTAIFAIASKLAQLRWGDGAKQAFAKLRKMATAVYEAIRVDAEPDSDA